MYYVLKPTYSLRGYEKLNTCLINEEGKTFFFNKDVYKVLLKCDGLFDSESVWFSSEERVIIDGLYRQNFLDRYEEAGHTLLPRQSYKVYDNRYIRHVHWSITGRCNYRCRHCYMSAPCGKLGELSLDECKRIIDDFVACGIFNVSLTGGEALVHPDFWKIVSYLKENKITISQIYSNGFLINEDFFAKCEEYDIKPEISLSFDGTNGQHEWLRGVQGALKHLTDALELCNKNGFRVFVEGCLHKGNLDTLRDSINFLEKYGVGTYKLSALMVCGEGANLAEYELTASQFYEAVLDYLPHYKEDMPKMNLLIQGISFRKGKVSISLCKNIEADKVENHCVCAHARQFMHITADGRVLPCIPVTNAEKMASRFPNILEKGLKQILSDSIYLDIISLTLKDYMNHNEECRNCPYLLKCAGGCRGMAAVESDSEDYFSKDINSCIFFKNGFYNRFEEAIFELKLTK